MKTFYVSPVGSDNNVGTEREQAFYTLTRARDAVREAKRSEEFHGACITVLSGQYAMAQGLHLDGQDSGTEEAPIIWKGEGDPIFSGAVSIQGFQPVTDPEILARLPKCAAPFVLECGTLVSFGAEAAVLHCPPIWNCSIRIRGRLLQGGPMRGSRGLQG